MPTTNAGNFISLDEAINITSAFRKGKDLILNPNYVGKGILPICETFDRGLFEKILQQEGCTGLRIYNSMDDSYKLHTVIVGVNAKNEDMLPSNTSDNGNQIIEQGERCPDVCPPPSALNS